MRRAALLALCSACAVSAQGPGHGMSKSTYAVSDALASGKWLEKYLPVTEASGCPNNVCKCGTQGRVTLEGNGGFGIHTVWAPGQDNKRADANGGKTLKEVEAIWSDGIGSLSQTYHSSVNTRGWVDNALTLRASAGLDSFVTALTAGGENFVTGTVAAAEGETQSTMYSVIVHIPNTQVVLELQSDTCTKCSSASLGHRGASEQPAEAASRAFPPPPPPPGTNILSPFKLSRAVTSVADVTAFYKTVFQVDPVSTTTGADGAKFVSFNHLNGATETVLMQFVERPGQTGTYNSQWFVSYLNATNRKYMGTDYKGCWDIWGDNHCALDQSTTDIGTFWKRWQTTGYPFWMHNTPGGVHLYAQDPSGWQIQFDGTFSNPPSDVFDRAQQNCYICCKDV